MNAKLPEALQEHLIEDMNVGAQGWTVPWAMWADRAGNLWLNGQYTIDEAPGGTVAMQILRAPDGYYVDIQRCQEYRWAPSEPAYIGGSYPLPVQKLIQ